MRCSAASAAPSAASRSRRRSGPRSSHSSTSHARSSSRPSPTKRGNAHGAGRRERREPVGFSAVEPRGLVRASTTLAKYSRPSRSKRPVASRDFGPAPASRPYRYELRASACSEVGDEVGGILEADLQAHQRAARPRARTARDALQVRRAPRGSRSRPSCSRARRARAPRRTRRPSPPAAVDELDREEPGRAEEVALPQRVARIGRAAPGAARASPSGAPRSRRAISSALASCARRRTSSVRMPRSARKRSSGLAVWPRSRAHVAQPRPPRLVRDHRAQQQVGVARRDTWSPPAPRGRRRARTSGRRRPWPRCCRGSPRRRARAPRARSPGSPAPRTCASPGSRGRPRACWASSAPRCPRRSSGS